MKTIFKQASHERHRTATRIHRANTATVLRLAVFALTAQGVVSFAQAQSTVTAAAATAVTTTGGSANHVTKFSGANTIVNSGITEVNGNVGINTTNPTARLFVNGNIESTGSVFGAGGTTAPNPAFAFTTGGNTGMFSPVGGTIAFSTFGNERMRLSGGTGFLGIGTTAPSSPLTVAGTIQSTSGGFKFPDGTVQSTAAKGAQGLVHDSTLNGAGSANSPLGIANPLDIGGNTLVVEGNSTAIEGISSGSVFTDAGVTGLGEQGGTGVFGNATIGVFASGRGFPGSTGVEGVSDDGNAGDTGVLGLSVSPGLAGLFIGDVNVSGNLSKSGGSFKIDDPLAPEDKYLYHSFVESPDMMNIYNGIVSTDQRGTAVVTMPEYFSALNRDFRYQLTPIGQFAQAIVATELSNNEFIIQTDKPNVKVSWQVTGVRQDAWANAHRIPVEEDKDASERGHYLHPELYNHPKEDAVIYVRHPELLQRQGTH